MNRKIYINRILLIISLSVLLSCGGSEETPLAKIITEQSRFLKGYPIEFSADLKAGAAASDYEFTFDFGDSTSATGIEVVHVYDSPGDYTVSLTITGSSGAEKDTRDIKVLNSLELMAIYSVRVDSPSGLTFGSNKSSLWTVSDKPGGRVYEIDTLGARIRSLNYNGNDLEGVSFDSRDSTLWMVDENLGQLIHLGSDGDVMSYQNISSVGDGGGLEGISMDVSHSRIFMVKEKDFGALITIDELSLTHSLQQISFAPDYSSIFYIPSQDKLWVLSDEASNVYLVNLDGSFQNVYAIDMVQPEGLVYDEERQIFYIIDDTTEKLHKYKFWD
ncbi:MAG: PKD domain-containing protein [Candidatus Marinimicrobia bacterium]|nr:PKD domain-containing protein [Candidatus Neomarinimicrobiota bacterium]MBT4361980.1 PKD domain-containing protein [Candidatus Neomarinimicrobiota bacterium]MBT4715651.1 PKD domain-containing protein [Candidatus Neomarinimicrobiota bacterium]MBT4947969.1 PKD domain-containing protein [Candidatus Neomarinimicrobiota bacterium]MBT5267834.1 PKD domain-containing protein [Candidatus Neomarinimicrobiota bacterium]